MYQFTDDCIIGIENIDNEHRKLFAMINAGMELVNSDDKIVLTVAREMVVRLKEYAMTHFSHEEAYMEQIRDAELGRQKREHAQFTEYVNKYDETLLNEENAKEKLGELLLYLSRWLYRHILGSDLMIGHCVEENQEDAFAFTDKYKTGIDLIDEEHKKLFEIISKTNDLINAEFLHDKYDAIINIIDELKEYTVLHFSDEEKYMEKIGYEGLSSQKVAHTAFVDRLNQINFDNVDDNQQEYLVELINYLLGWLSTHILKMDKRIPIYDVNGVVE